MTPDEQKIRQLIALAASIRATLPHSASKIWREEIWPLIQKVAAENIK